MPDRVEVVDLLSRSHLFRGIEEQKIQQAVDLLEEVKIADQTILYTQNEDPDFFYFILHGKVRLSRNDNHDPQPRIIGTLEKYDYFGQEVLETDWPRQVTVEAAGEVTLLRLSVTNFISLIELIPEMPQRLQMILDSYRLLLRTHFNWINADEMIHFVSRRHVLFMVKRILPPLLFGGVFIPLALFYELSAILSLMPLILLIAAITVTVGWLAWAYIDWTNDYFVVTTQRVVFLEKVVLIYDSRQEAPLEAVQSTFTTTSQMGRILRFGNVAIRTYIGTILFKDVPYPEQVMALVQEQQARTQIRNIFDEQSDIHKRIDTRITQGPVMPPLPRLPKPVARPSGTQQFLATMFHQRFETGGTIIYRTHFIILLQRIWMPTLLLLAMAVLFIYSAADQFTVFSAVATCSLTGLFGMIVGGWWFYQYMDWHNDIYLITGDQVVDVNKKPLGRESRQTAPLKNIQSIEYKRLGIIGRFLNYGTVYIRVGDQTLTFDDVYRPSDVQRELFDRLAKRRREEQQKDLEDQRRRLADWVAGYDDWHKNHPQTPPPAATPPARPPSRPGF